MILFNVYDTILEVVHCYFFGDEACTEHKVSHFISITEFAKVLTVFFTEVAVYCFDVKAEVL